MNFDNKEKVFSISEYMTWEKFIEKFKHKLTNGWRLDFNSFMKFIK